MDFGSIIIIIIIMGGFFSFFLKGKMWNRGMGFRFGVRGGSCYELVFSEW